MTPAPPNWEKWPPLFGAITSCGWPWPWHRGELDHLDAPQFAAAIAALVTENSRPDSWCNYKLSPTVEAALEGLRTIRRELIREQHRHQVIVPVWMEYDLVGLVEQWADQIEWTELCDNTSLDEGDIVRVLRRTLDVLSQIPHVPYLPRVCIPSPVRLGM